MNRIWLLLSFTILFNCEKQKEVDIAYVSNHFNKHIDDIEKIQYNVKNQITFSDGNAWDNKGFAVLEKEPQDTVFGFSFYGIRNDINKSSIYKDGIGFLVLNKENTFEQEKGGLHFLGSPGGQMIYKDFFTLDSDYETVEIEETENSFILNYKFEDDLKNNVTEKTKTLQLNKTNFLPEKVTTSSQPDFGGKQTIVYIFDDIKTNSDVEKNINAYIQDLNEMELIKEAEIKPNPLLNKAFPKISLQKLFNENETEELKSGKVTLIDFWEVWCGWCIKSFPEVEKIKKKYSEDLDVIGIVSQNTENAKKLVEKKGITFLNLIGNKELNTTFSVNSWPRYFLVDQYGVIKKEYHGFSEDIEKDIVAEIQSK